MERKQDGLVPRVFSGLDGPGKALEPRLRHCTTSPAPIRWTSLSGLAKQMPISVSMALCSLPRTNPGNQHQYKRQSGADPNPRERSRPLSFRVHANASYCQKLGMDASGGAVPTYRYTDFFRSCSKS